MFFLLFPYIIIYYIILLFIIITLQTLYVVFR